MDLDELNLMDKPQYQVFEENDDCPNCDGRLVERRAKSFDGFIERQGFLSCTNYPRCDFKA